MSELTRHRSLFHLTTFTSACTPRTFSRSPATTARDPPRAPHIQCAAISNETPLPPARSDSVHDKIRADPSFVSGKEYTKPATLKGHQKKRAIQQRKFYVQQKKAWQAWKEEQEDSDEEDSDEE